MIFTLYSEDGLQSFQFYGDRTEPDSMVLQRFALVARAPGKPKHVASWCKTGESLISKKKARKIWKDLVANGATRKDVHYS